MSRLSKKPIAITSGVTITHDGDYLVMKGPKGEKRLLILPFITVTIQGDAVKISSEHNHKQARINQGTMSALVRNTIQGVAEGFSKTLEIHGVGYRATLEGKTLILNLGFSNPIRFEGPEDVTIAVEKNLIKITGHDKESVGQAAAEIRSFRKPEPYKGKGIRYEGEVVRRKTGKKAATAGAA